MSIHLPDVSRQQVEDTLASFRTALNHVHAHYLKGEVAFEYFFAHDDADALVYHLSMPMQTEERRRERFSQGRPLPEDLELPPEV